ncbi:hypothetical protein GCM10012284_08080 [Mangrovihabitans endophyticus]|uniref:HTH araC/xylS-type domain-containing protein n=1 Tax=Mangrovihabitans endophyticus TaxID=1751298 RepID=A0A8J3BWD2_9ACTN|nr:hypothetical protein GCM10012284_08080 [Mangrovihabitans endophyticus]
MKQRGRGVSADHAEAVTRAIDEMRAGLGRAQPLAALARTGMFSPFHFHRIFRDTTAFTPARFLTALRMAEARRLLLHSSMPVHRVGTRVGYTSNGGFITHFGRVVGMSPTRFRSLVRALGDTRAGEWLPSLPDVLDSPGETVVARHASSVPASLAMSWLFTPGQPPGRPCTTSVGGGTSRIRLPRPPGPGAYWVVTMIVPAQSRILDALVDDVPESYLVGRSRLSLNRQELRPVVVPVHLRRPERTDPPVAAVAPLCWSPM